MGGNARGERGLIVRCLGALQPVPLIFHLTQNLRHGFEWIGVGGLETTGVIGAAAHSHLAIESVHLLLTAPGLEQIVGCPQLSEPILD